MSGNERDFLPHSLSISLTEELDNSKLELDLHSLGTEESRSNECVIEKADLTSIFDGEHAFNHLTFEDGRRAQALSSLFPPFGGSEMGSNFFDQASILSHYLRYSRDDVMRQARLRELETRAEEAFVAMGNTHSGHNPYVWNGELPPRNYTHPIFSCKIFVGGVPWDVSEASLMNAFSPYGICKVEWPGREARFASRQCPRGKTTGYVYIIFDQEKSVRSLLQSCSQDFGRAGEWYFNLEIRRSQHTERRQVQVIPWVASDATYVADPACRLDPKKTVFVGALHGMITAHVLYSIMKELYGDVVFVGIDTDKYKYPIGSGRVTFASHSSYFRAIESAFVEIKTSKFTKKVQIDPFLEESICMVCNRLPGFYFCRDRFCFRYYCSACWNARHIFSEHRPLTRKASRANLGPHNSNWMLQGRPIIDANALPPQQREKSSPGFVGHRSSLSMRRQHGLDLTLGALSSMSLGELDCSLGSPCTPLSEGYGSPQSPNTSLLQMGSGGFTYPGPFYNE